MTGVLQPDMIACSGLTYQLVEGQKAASYRWEKRISVKSVTSGKERLI
jgi:hypothetical protein